MALAVGAGVALSVRPAAAACGDPDRAFVEIQFVGHRDEARESSLIDALAADLAERSLDLCPARPADGLPSANLEVEWQTPDGVAVRVDSGRDDGPRGLSRSIDLAQMPGDARLFAVTLAIDELLRAALPELAAEWLDAPATPEFAGDVPSEGAVQGPGGVAARLRTPADAGPAGAERELAWRLGARVASERFAGGQTHFGVDALVAMPLGRALALELAAGGRRGLDVTTPNGRVESRALGLSAWIAWPLVQGPLEAGIGGGVRAAWVEMRGAPAGEGSVASSLAALSAYAELGGFASLAVTGSLRCSVSAALGAPLRTIEALDAGRSATAVSGLELAVAGTLAVDL